MQFFLTDSGVHSPKYAMESEFASFDEDWKTGLGRLSATHARNGPVRGLLEVNCHGTPGHLHLKPGVSFKNVVAFGEAVSRLLMPGSTIEILACHVGSLPNIAMREGEQLTHAKLLGDKGLRERMNAISAYQSWANQQMNAINRVYGNKTKTQAILKDYRARSIELSNDEISQSYQFWVDIAEERPEIGLKTAEPDEGQQAAAKALGGTISRRITVLNAPYFCALLAKASRCTVTAAGIVQLEEGMIVGESDPLWTKSYKFGNWEGQLIDFYPNGKAFCRGQNVKRVGVNKDGKPFTHWVAA
jgi:hypothetical protein